jgi:hypothetical protein
MAGGRLAMPDLVCGAPCSPVSSLQTCATRYATCEKYFKNGRLSRGRNCIEALMRGSGRYRRGRKSAHDGSPSRCNRRCGELASVPPAPPSASARRDWTFVPQREGVSRSMFVDSPVQRGRVHSWRLFDTHASPLGNSNSSSDVATICVLYPGCVGGMYRPFFMRTGQQKCSCR